MHDPGGLPVSDHQIAVMTQNQYDGGDLLDFIYEPNAEAFNAGVLGLIENLETTDFRLRSVLLAASILLWQPDAASLQEVADIAFNGAHDHGPVYRDHLQDTLAALILLGQDYTVAAEVQNWTFQSPVDFDGDGVPDGDFRLGDKNAILVRSELSTTKVTFDCALVSLDGCNYDVFLTIQTPVGTFERLEGFVAVDIAAGVRNYRVANTQLERADIDPGNPFSRAIQAAQADQLIEALDVAPPHTAVIIAASTHSTPDDEEIEAGPFTIVPPYLQLLEAGYYDTWMIDTDVEPGVTCCQDLDLQNEVSSLSARIDQIWSDVEPLVVNATVLGDLPGDRALFGLWPSLHASVVAVLSY